MACSGYFSETFHSTISVTPTLELASHFLRVCLSKEETVRSPFALCVVVSFAIIRLSAENKKKIFHFNYNFFLFNFLSAPFRLVECTYSTRLVINNWNLWVQSKEKLRRVGRIAHKKKRRIQCFFTCDSLLEWGNYWWRHKQMTSIRQCEMRSFFFALV